MKSVVHIGTSDKEGGAAIAAWRLHQGMLNLDVDSRVVSRHRSWTGPEVSCVSTPLFEAADLFHLGRVVPAQSATATLFSLSPVSVPILDHPWVAAADIIHLHWVAHFLSPEDISDLCKAGKTIFWTFHDQWAYTGGCHYIAGSLRQKEDWDGTAQIGQSVHALAKSEYARKTELLKGAPIHVIAPSRWMAREAVASGIFAAGQISVVPYGINTRIFKPANSDSTLDQESSGKSGIRLVFGCQYLGERRKGFFELREALEICMLDHRFLHAVETGTITLATFGGIPEKGLELPVPATHLGKLDGDAKVAAVFHQSSGFICPTLEDNLPSVVMESIACGCPVIAFATGGVPDMVRHGINGLLAPTGGVKALAAHILDFCLDASLRQKLRHGANSFDLESNSLEAQAEAVLRLYELASPNTGESNRLAPDCLPSITVNARLVSHFGTEISLMLIEEKNTVKLQLTGQIENLNTTIVQTWEQVARSQQQMAESLQQIDQLQHLLKRETSTRIRQSLVLEKLKLKLGQAARKQDNLRGKITNLKEQNRKLQKPPEKKSTLQRVRQYFLRRLTRNGSDLRAR